MSALTREMATYQQNLPRLLDHENEYVLIKDEHILGFFQTRYEALEEGYKHYLDEAFLVRLVLPVDPLRQLTRDISPG